MWKITENKEGDIDGVHASIGWVEFSNPGRSIFYRGRALSWVSGGGVRGNYIDADTGEKYQSSARVRVIEEPDAGKLYDPIATIRPYYFQFLQAFFSSNARINWQIIVDTYNYTYNYTYITFERMELWDRLLYI